MLGGLNIIPVGHTAAIVTVGWTLFCINAGVKSPGLCASFGDAAR